MSCFPYLSLMQKVDMQYLTVHVRILSDPLNRSHKIETGFPDIGAM